MRYVSTRGEAPPLGFIEATLAGLARDGGLYVPETWPKLSPQTIAGFAGRPYAEVAVEVIRPFVGDAIRGTRIVAHRARGLWHVPPSRGRARLPQLGANTFLLELFHGPTLAFKDLAMQFLARLMDHALEQRGERATIVVATSGDTGGAAVEAFRGRSRIDLFVLFPQGRISDVQRRMMTTAEDDNVHALAIEGNFDDCQAHGEGHVQSSCLCRQRALVGRELDQLGAHRRAGGLLFHRRGQRSARPRARWRSRCRPEISATCLRAMSPRAWACPIDRLVVATNVNDILVRTLATGAYELRDVVATTSPSMDIQVSSNFERLLFEACGRDGTRGRRR